MKKIIKYLAISILFSASLFNAAHAEHTSAVGVPQSFLIFQGNSTVMVNMPAPAEAAAYGVYTIWFTLTSSDYSSVLDFQLATQTVLGSYLTGKKIRIYHNSNTGGNVVRYLAGVD